MMVAPIPATIINVNVADITPTLNSMRSAPLMPAPVAGEPRYSRRPPPYAARASPFRLKSSAIAGPRRGASAPSARANRARSTIREWPSCGGSMVGSRNAPVFGKLRGAPTWPDCLLPSYSIAEDCDHGAHEHRE